VIFGWLFDVALWAIGLVCAAGYVWLYRRRVGSVTLEPWSKERGIVLWLFHRKSLTGGQPRIVWDDAKATDERAR
jgi:hypothetical protein